MGQKSKNKLYNYLVNTFGLSKETILEYADERVKELLAKHVDDKLNSERMEYMILGTISNIVEKGFGEHSPYYDRKVAFDKYVQKIIEKEVRKRLNKDFTIDVKVINNNDR